MTTTESGQPSGVSGVVRDMPLRLVIAATVLTVAVVLAVTSEGSAQKPPKPGATTLKTSAQQVTFSQPVALTGKVKGAKQAVTVSLERRAANSTAFVPAGTATSDANGDFSFADQPSKSSVYRATTGTAASPEVAVAVAPLVGLKIGDPTPHKGRRVRFKGTVRPQHDGTRVAIQRKRADGTWATVRSPLLRDAGSRYSRYSKRIRIRRSGTYRTVIAAHADHAQGVSRERTLTVGG
jgi:hypothetical protein